MKALVEIRSVDSIMLDDNFFLKFSFEERGIIIHSMKKYTRQFIDRASQVVKMKMIEEGMYEIDRKPIEDLEWEMI